MPDYRGPFTRIYEESLWESAESQSGIGSEPAHTQVYRRVVEDFIIRHRIRDVVDFGCGDLLGGSPLNLHGARYTGIDIVEPLIEANEARYPQHEFVCADLLEIDVAGADLLLCKDVLQHLPNQAVRDFLQRQVPKFTYAIITNDREHYARGRIPFLKQRIGVINRDIEAGGWRPLDLSAPPFDLACSVLMEYRVVQKPRVWIKQMVLVRG